MVRFTFFVIFMSVSLGGVTAQYDKCAGQLDKINDGECDTDNNNADCGYDGGDCCECSCMNDHIYPCGILGFNCSDPDITGHEGKCYNETAFMRYCPSDSPNPWLVSDTASAMSLAEAVNCSGGTFNVTWLGNVLVNRTLYIPNGTTLYVTGEGTGAEVNGGGKTRLFMAVGAHLQIDSLILKNGNATYGGAIASIRSSIFLNQTVFSGNTASSYGGAINVGIASTLVLEGESMFIGNYAGLGGGAVAISMGTLGFRGGQSYFLVKSDVGDSRFGGEDFVNDHSLVLWERVLQFSNNTARYYGGALFVSLDSNVSWDGETSFVGNTADIGGGGLFVSSASNVSWDGETSFVGNTATLYGGALYITFESNVSWDGETSFVSNTADNGGGALFVSSASNVSWDGVTSFIDNTVRLYGGALYIKLESNVLWDGETSFVGNMARLDGGALSIRLDSSASWDGVTYFGNNTANSNGGALIIFSGSRASWDGVTYFRNNTADSKGGALFIQENSIGSWDGETSFFGNTANYNGGALSVHSGCSVSWDGETSFVGNTVRIDGGALSVESGSRASWNGLTYFANNMANNNGGALSVFSDCSASWDGETFFVNNTASVDGGALNVFSACSTWWGGKTYFVGNTAKKDGGALFVSLDSNVSWDEKASFIDNFASSSGGAIYVETSSKISVGGDTCFFDNEADIDGGAVYVYVGHDDGTSSYFILDNNSTVVFQGNTCGGNGGAIAFIGEVVTRFSVNMTFLKNTAGIAGGAIYISGVTIGIRFEGVIYMSNSAVIGGGLYMTGSGTAITQDIKGNLKQNPTTFIGCKFIGNTAMKTGGAMDTGAGRDWIENTSFVGNTASLGGALRLVGTTSLIGCDFVNNLSGEDGGPGISNDGAIESASHCSFVDNSFNCLTGFFLAYNDTGAQFDTVCKGCDTLCTGCTVKDKEPICLEELAHSHSPGDNTTLESLLIEPGYWRATNTSMDILACYNPDACLGGLTGDQDYCSEGYEGPYCFTCSKRYTTSLGFTCSKCSENAAGGIALAATMTVVFLLASVAFLSYMLSGETETADQSFVARVTRFIPPHSVKITIVVWQILTQFSAVASAVFPSVYQKFLDGVDILNFDLSWIFPAECIIDTDFHDDLFLATLGPLVCIVILGGTYVAAMRRSRDSETARGIARRKHVSMVLLLTFLIYSSVSSTLFKTFACDKLDDGKNYLRADYSIECDSFKHTALEIYAGFMVVLYVVGIPSFYGVLLYNNREALMNNAGREEDDSIMFITDLWKPYRPDRFYYEVIECVRRVLLTGALVFIYPNTAAQIAVALMMATFFMIVSEALAPYASSWDTWINRMGHAIVFTSMFLALLLKVDVSGERAGSQKIFEWVLVTVNSSLILSVVIEAIAMIVTWRREVIEDVAPRIHRRLNVLSPGVRRVGTIFEEDIIS